MAASLSPLGEPVVTQAAGPPLSVLNPSDIHVLLVDDERLTRLVVGNLLRTCKYKVTIAESGAQALDVLSKAGPGAFQLILTDVMMPDVGGLELLRFVRSHQHLYNVPVIMMSASDEQETMCAALLGSADEYLVKPVTRKEVQNIWTHVMKRYHAAMAPPAAVPEAAQEPPAQAAAATAAAGAGAAWPDLSAGGRGTLLSLSLGIGSGLGLPPQIARDMMNAAALAASTTAGAGGAAGMTQQLQGGPSCHPGKAAPGAAAAAPGAPGGPLAGHIEADAAALGPPSGGGRGTGQLANGGCGHGTALLGVQATRACSGGGSRGGGSSGGASKVNLLKWLRRPTRTVQAKESFRIFCEVLLLLDNVHAAAGAQQACGLRPSKLVLYSNGRVAFAPRPGSATAAGAGAGVGGAVTSAAKGRGGNGCGAAEGTTRKRPRQEAAGEGNASPIRDEAGPASVVHEHDGMQVDDAGGAASGPGEEVAACRRAAGEPGLGSGSCGLQQQQQQECEHHQAGQPHAAGGSSQGAACGCPVGQQHDGNQPHGSRHRHQQQQDRQQQQQQPEDGNACGMVGTVQDAGAAGGDTDEAAAPTAGASGAGGGAAAHAAGGGPGSDDDEDALYRSPEEERGLPATSASDMFSLGLLFFELFHSCTGQERSALLRDARQRVLPASFSRQQPKEAAFALALLHPEPASRPALEELLGSTMFRATCASLRQRGQQRAAAAGARDGAAAAAGGTGAGAAAGGTIGEGQQAVAGNGPLMSNPAGCEPGALAQRGPAAHGSRPGRGAAGAKPPPGPHRLAHGSGPAGIVAGAPGPVLGVPGSAGGVAAGAGAGGGGLSHSLSPSPSLGPGGGLRADDAVLLEFLKMLRKRKMEELAQVESELAFLTSDAQVVEQYLQYLLQTRTARRQRGAGAGAPAGCSNQLGSAAGDPAAAAAVASIPGLSALAPPHSLGNAAAASPGTSCYPPEHRPAAAAAAAGTAAGPATTPAAPEAATAPLANVPCPGPLAGAPAPPCYRAQSAAWSEQHQAAQSKWCRVAHKFEQLESVFTERRQPPRQDAHGAALMSSPGLMVNLGAPASSSLDPYHSSSDAAGAASAAAQRRRRHADAGGLPEPLLRFAEDLSAFATYTTLTPLASLRYGDPPTANSMVAGAAFDRDDEFFAVAGVSKRIKIFEREAVLKPTVGAHYPVLEISSRSRLSSVTWSGYIKGHLASADYEGVVQLWDANTNTELLQLEEHRKRVWSIDFSQADPARLISGGDDGLVKLWSIQQETSTATIDLRANVCSVQFSPSSPHLLAAGCANYRIFLYDLRSAARPLHVLSGHSRAVSYVRFLSPTQLVSASTDNTLRLWQLDRPGAGAGSGGPDGSSAPRCVQVFRGHTNERNFTGLSASPDGYICCGSENNRVFCYHQSMPMPVASYDFAGGTAEEGQLGHHHHHHHHHGGGGGGPTGAGGQGIGAGAGGVLEGSAAAAGGGGTGGGGALSSVLGSAFVGGGAEGGGGGGGAASSSPAAGQFVSSVCWSRRSNLLLAANSVGCIKLFTLH